MTYGLFGTVELNPAGRDLLAQKKYSHMSIEFDEYPYPSLDANPDLKPKDAEGNVVDAGPIPWGGSLTIKPVIKGMKPVFMSEDEAMAVMDSDDAPGAETCPPIQVVARLAEDENGEDVIELQLLREGKFPTKRYGELEFTKDWMDRLVENFKAFTEKHGFKVALKREHGNDDEGAYGWFKAFEVRPVEMAEERTEAGETAESEEKGTEGGEIQPVETAEGEEEGTKTADIQPTEAVEGEEEGAEEEVEAVEEEAETEEAAEDDEIDEEGTKAGMEALVDEVATELSDEFSQEEIDRMVEEENARIEAEHPREMADEVRSAFDALEDRVRTLRERIEKRRDDEEFWQIWGEAEGLINDIRGSDALSKIDKDARIRDVCGELAGMITARFLAEGSSCEDFEEGIRRIRTLSAGGRTDMAEAEKMQELEAKVVELTTQVEELEGARNTLQAANDALEKEKADLETVRADLETANAELSQKVEELTPEPEPESYSKEETDAKIRAAVEAEQKRMAEEQRRKDLVRSLRSGSRKDGRYAFSQPVGEMIDRTILATPDEDGLILLSEDGEPVTRDDAVVQILRNIRKDGLVDLAEITDTGDQPEGPEGINLSDTSVEGADPESIKLDQKIRKLMKEHPDLSYEDAMIQAAD